jgi:hypothetical protein
MKSQSSWNEEHETDIPRDAKCKRRRIEDQAMALQICGIQKKLVRPFDVIIATMVT